MWYYNQNQITRMKIDKSEFKMKQTKTKYPEEFIQKVIYQFEPNCQSKSQRVFTMRKRGIQVFMKSDWDKFQLIIFNIL